MKLLLLLLSLTAHAESFGPNCPDLAVTGVKSKEELGKYLKYLKSAAVMRDPLSMGKYVLYPLRVNLKPKKRLVKTEAGLQKYFSEIFTDKVLKAIEEQKIFCRDQGVMLGDGELWINEKVGKIGISVVNP